MTANTPIKCFRYLVGAFYVQDYADRMALYATAANDDAAFWIKKALREQHGRPVLDWDEEFHEPTNLTETPQATVRRFASELVERDKRLMALRNAVEIQGQDGNWNTDPYMHGFYNGMELSLATMEDRATEYRDAPPTWVSQQANVDNLEEPDCGEGCTKHRTCREMSEGV